MFKNGAAALNFRGEVFTVDNINLFKYRDFMETMRSSGMQQEQ